MPDNKSRNIFKHPSVAVDYDNFYQSESGKLIDRIEKELILSHLKHLPKGKLLELGCGTGHWSEFFNQSGFRCLAIDDSDAMLAIAERKEIKGVIFQKADAENLPFPDNHFPIIVSITMLEFVENLNRVMEEIDRVLAPGGTVVLGCLNSLSEIGKNKHKDPVFKHGRFFTPEAVTNLLNRFGNPSLSSGVYLSDDYEILDHSSMQDNVQPVFIAASVKKNKEYGNYRRN